MFSVDADHLRNNQAFQAYTAAVSYSAAPHIPQLGPESEDVRKLQVPVPERMPGRAEEVRVSVE